VQGKNVKNTGGWAPEVINAACGLKKLTAHSFVAFQARMFIGCFKAPWPVCNLFQRQHR
jgi:hypothetical protein